MRKGRILGCTEFAVLGKMLEDKLRALEAREMWLELVNNGKKRKSSFYFTSSGKEN